MTREEKQKAINALKISAPIMAVTQEEFNDYIQTLNKIMDWLEQEPTTIRKVGKWICVHHIENKITYDSWKCSECQHDFNSEEESVVDFDEYKYCPNCGADMRGSEE